MSRCAFIETWPDLPMMMWSWTVMPSGLATSLIWRGIAGRMAVDEDQRGGTELETALDHFARVDRRVVDGALLLDLVGDQAVLLVEEEYADLLDVLERHGRA